MKNFIKAIAIAVSTTLIFTACAESNERNSDSVIEENSSSVIAEENSSVKAEENVNSSSAATEVEIPAEETSSTSSSAKVEESTSSSSSATSTSKVESKPTETSSTTSSQKPATPSSSSTSKPSSSTTTSSSKPTEKPVEQPTHTHTFTKATCITPATCTGCGETKGTTTDHNFKNGKCTTCGKADPNYVAPHNCATDGHVWGTPTTKTEEKWFVERHIVDDFGFDMTLGDYNAFLRNMEAMGIPGDSGSSTLNVQIWVIETTETRECLECHKTDTNTTRTPIGDWQYIPGQKNHHDSSYDMFDTLFYDANNIPPEIIEKIKLFWETYYGFSF
ncbi:MAG: hypothetical protein J1F04_08190 [Oscillospiraceae bacterium]|nr:hypothetical protein [Oscillospiraceae bacterium]